MTFRGKTVGIGHNLLATTRPDLEFPGFGRLVPREIGRKASLVILKGCLELLQVPDGDLHLVQGLLHLQDHVSEILNYFLQLYLVLNFSPSSLF